MERDSLWQQRWTIAAASLGALVVVLAAVFVWTVFLAPPAGEPIPSPTAAAPISPSPDISPSPEPPISPSPELSPSPEVSPSPTASPTASPLATPTVAPRPSPPPPAGPTPVPPPGWIEITDFPTYSGPMSVDSIIAGGPGFVAIGYSWDQNRGRVWTSADGQSWIAQPDAQFAGFSPLKVVRFGDDLLLFGSDRDGWRVWRSSDGRNWTDMGVPSGLTGGITDVVAVGGVLVLAGGIEDPDYQGAVWRSTDGVDWVRVAAPEASIGGGGVELYALAARGSTLVGVDRFGVSIYYSTDLADSWRRAAIDFQFDEEDGGLVSIAASGERFVVVGYADTYDYPPIALASLDGTSWSAVIPPGGDLLGHVVALPDGRFVAFDGRPLLSSDGSTWTELPPYTTERPPVPPEPGDEVVTERAVAASGAGVVVAQEWGDSVRVWFGPLSLFR